jgi:hypothetical protein
MVYGYAYSTDATYAGSTEITSPGLALAVFNSKQGLIVDDYCMTYQDAYLGTWNSTERSLEFNGFGLYNIEEGNWKAKGEVIVTEGEMETVGTYYYDYVNAKAIVTIGDKEYEASFIAGGHMYNDFGHTEHWGVFSDNAPENIHLDYCGPTECMWCGTSCSSWGESHHVMCCDCIDIEPEDYCYCDCCGNSGYSDDMYWVGDECLCSHCFDRNCCEDEITGDYIWNEDAIRIVLARKTDQPNFDNDYGLWTHESVTDPWTWSESNRRWYSRYADCAPHATANPKEYYWNVEDLDVQGLRNFFCIYDIDKYLTTAD